MVLTKTTFGICEILQIEILTIICVRVNIRPNMGVQISKRYYFQTCPDFFLPMVLTKLRWAFLKFKFSDFYRFFFENFNSPLYPMEKTKTSVTWKTIDRRATRSEICDSWVLVHVEDICMAYLSHNVQCQFGVICGAFTIFRYLGLMIRDRRKYFEWLYELNGER